MADIAAIVKELFTHVPERSTHEELTFICPQCGDESGNRSVNLRSGLTHCWRCGKKPGASGDFVRWCRRLGFKIEDVGDSAISLTEAEKLLQQVEKEKFMPVVTNVKLPKGFTRLKDDPQSGYCRLIRKMAERKGLSLKDLEEMDAGFTKESMLWEPYAIFPVYEYGQLVYYQGRTYVDDPGKGTKRFPSRDECPYGMSYWVYNIDAIRLKRPSLVVVVEAIFNVKSLEKVCDDFVPVCVFKHSISNVQLQKIASFDSVKEICVLYDSDSTADAWVEVGSRVVNRNFQVSIARMPVPEGRKKADPNDDPVLACQALNERELYTSSGELKAILGSL